eukprot:5579989-Pyramimonas_sp.AAC.1
MLSSPPTTNTAAPTLWYYAGEGQGLGAVQRGGRQRGGPVPGGGRRAGERVHAGQGQARHEEQRQHRRRQGLQDQDGHQPLQVGR